MPTDIIILTALAVIILIIVILVIMKCTRSKKAAKGCATKSIMCKCNPNGGICMCAVGCVNCKKYGCAANANSNACVGAQVRNRFRTETIESDSVRKHKYRVIIDDVMGQTSIKNVVFVGHPEARQFTPTTEDILLLKEGKLTELRNKLLKPSVSAKTDISSVNIIDPNTTKTFEITAFANDKVTVFATISPNHNSFYRKTVTVPSLNPVLNKFEKTRTIMGEDLYVYTEKGVLETVTGFPKDFLEFTVKFVI